MICFVFGASYKNAVYHFVCICDFITLFCECQQQEIACTRFFTQICHRFSVCAFCLKFSASLFAPYKFMQAVPYFSCVFKRQQITKFAKFMKPLSQRLQLFNCISLVFSKISEILQEYFLFSHFNRLRTISFSCAS